MTDTSPDTSQPAIQVRCSPGRVDIEQARPAVLSALAETKVEQALALIPSLLPICGAAQSIAARRAVEAALGRLPDEQEQQQRERSLWREQALSAAWRLAVDWPDLLGEPRRMQWLKALRAAADGELAQLLLEELDAPSRLSGAEDLMAWAGDTPGLAARVVRGPGTAVTTSTPAAVRRVGGDELIAVARRSLAIDPFNPQAPIDEPLEVGPLAMARDPMIPQLESTVPGRLAAMVLDMRYIALQLAGEERGALLDCMWHEGEQIGSGCATTARGPVFHRVSLGGDEEVVQWRALAPTDWHFAPAGAVRATLAVCRDESAGRRAIASFDPCAPCSLHWSGSETHA